MDWNAFKKKTLQLLGGLIMERSEDGTYVVSVGRVAWWLAFFPAVGIWLAGKGQMSEVGALKDIAPNHLNILLVLMAYNFGKKVTDVVKSITTKTTTTETAEEKGEKDGPG